MHSVMAVAKGLAMMSGKIKAGSTMASCWMFPVPSPKLWWVEVRA